jgi:hypothetical protein
MQESEFTGCANKVQGNPQNREKKPLVARAQIYPRITLEVLRFRSAIRASWETGPPARTEKFALPVNAK